MTAAGFIVALAATAAAALPDGVYPLRGLDDLAAFDRVLGDAKVVALGETRHTSEGFYAAKARLIRHLVEERGFRVLAIENPWIWTEKTAAYVKGEDVSLDDALSGLYGVWRAESVRDLLVWLRQRNERNPADPVRVFGFDIRQPREYLARLSVKLAGCPDDEKGNFTRAQYENCFMAIDEERAALGRSPDPWLRLALDGYEAWARMMYSDLFEGGLRNLESHDIRDRALADAFLTIRALREPKAKIVVWAANFHIAASPLARTTYRGRPVPARVRRMGVMLAEKLGRDYAPVGLIANEVETNWPRIPSQSKPVEALSLEAKIGGYGEDYLLLGPAFLKKHKDYLLEDYSYPAYAVDKDFRALLFLRRSPPARMLGAPPD